MLSNETTRRIDLNNPRLFSERAYLEFSFVYAKELSGLKSSFKVTIPLYENPTIAEDKQARLATLRPVGRNSDLYAFLGADSANVKLSFNLTLPHITYHCNKLNLTDYIKVYKADDKESFKVDKPKTKNPILDPNNILNVIKDFQDAFLPSREDILLENTTIFPTGQSSPLTFGEQNTLSVSNEEVKIKALYYFWTNIIRCSVIGTSDHTSGPPLLRFSYGPLYKRAPFLVKQYQISIEEKTGYDVTTLLPLKVKITLNLQELRVGNFSEYKAYNGPRGVGTIEESENVAGWEYVLETGSLDPLYSNVREGI